MKHPIAPYSVFDTREKKWRERKHLWLCLGIKSEEGRDSNLMKFSPTLVDEGVEGTSIFDPVLTEAMYQWFVPRGGSILDPFAGGSVRGIVAELNGYHYTGIELRPEQVESNKEQAENLGISPNWVVGDSLKILDSINDKFDFIFTSPPYFDLEKYSDIVEDLSNFKKYDDFLESYCKIIKKSVSLLRDNRFACFVVSDVRDKQGIYRGFDIDTINAFRNEGLNLYNRGVLVNSTASLSIRMNRIWMNKKFGRHHQDVLVFYKGDVNKIKGIFPKKGFYLEPSIDTWIPTITVGKTTKKSRKSIENPQNSDSYHYAKLSKLQKSMLKEIYFHNQKMKIKDLISKNELSKSKYDVKNHSMLALIKPRGLLKKVNEGKYVKEVELTSEGEKLVEEMLLYNKAGLIINKGKLRNILRKVIYDDAYNYRKISIEDGLLFIQKINFDMNNKWKRSEGDTDKFEGFKNVKGKASIELSRDDIKTLIKFPKQKYGKQRKIPNVVFEILGNRVKISDGRSINLVQGQLPLEAICSRLGINSQDKIRFLVV